MAIIASMYDHQVPGMMTMLQMIKGSSENTDRVLGLAYALQH